MTTTTPTTIHNDEISKLSAWGLVKLLISSAARSAVRVSSTLEAGLITVETTIGLAQNEIDALGEEQHIRLDTLQDERKVRAAERLALKQKQNQDQIDEMSSHGSDGEVQLTNVK